MAPKYKLSRPPRPYKPPVPKRPDEKGLTFYEILRKGLVKVYISSESPLHGPPGRMGLPPSMWLSWQLKARGYPRPAGDKRRIPMSVVLDIVKQEMGKQNRHYKLYKLHQEARQYYSRIVKIIRDIITKKDAVNRWDIHRLGLMYDPLTLTPIKSLKEIEDKIEELEGDKTAELSWERLYQINLAARKVYQKINDLPELPSLTWQFPPLDKIFREIPEHPLEGVDYRVSPYPIPQKRDRSNYIPLDTWEDIDALPDEPPEGYFDDNTDEEPETQEPLAPQKIIETLTTTTNPQLPDDYLNY